MKFRPLHDRVVVKRFDAEEKSAGGIIIPDTAKEKPSQGEVVAVGPGGRDEAGKLIPIDIEVGDRVLFGKWSGTEVKIDGQDLLIMKEFDIMGIIDEPVTKKKPRNEHNFTCRPSARGLPSPLTPADATDPGELRWLPKKSNFRSMRATRCCAASTFFPMR